MSEQSSILEGVISQIPFGLFILTTAHDGHRGGVLARWVQRCAVHPPMVMVAIPKGQSVEPLILNSRSFSLCRISPDDRYLMRKFTTPPERGEDLFVAISTRNAPSGSPIVDRAISYLDCQVIRHLELESDHRVYVGEVQAAGSIRTMPSMPEFPIHLNGDILQQRTEMRERTSDDELHADVDPARGELGETRPFNAERHADANGEHHTDAKGEHQADANGEHHADANGEHHADANGTNGASTRPSEDGHSIE